MSFTSFPSSREGTLGTSLEDRPVLFKKAADILPVVSSTYRNIFIECVEVFKNLKSFDFKKPFCFFRVLCKPMKTHKSTIVCYELLRSCNSEVIIGYNFSSLSPPGVE